MSTYCNKYPYQYPNPTFFGVSSAQLISAKSTSGLEYSLRIIGNKISDLLQPKVAKKITENIA